MKNTKNSKNTHKRTKKCNRWMEDFQEMGTLRLKPVIEAFLENLGNEFVNWYRETASKHPKNGSTP